MVCSRAIKLLRDDLVAWLSGSLANSDLYLFSNQPLCSPKRSIVAALSCFIGMHTLVYVFSRSQVHERRAHRSTEDLVVVCLRLLLYLGGILRLARAKLFGGEFMPAGAASPAFGWLRLSPIPRTMPCFVRRPKRQDQFTTALKTIPMHHIRSYYNEVRVRWSHWTSQSA
jgi:hypothetical protein